MYKFNCIACDAPISAKYVDIQNLTATCPSCGELHDLKQILNLSSRVIYEASQIRDIDISDVRCPMCGKRIITKHLNLTIQVAICPACNIFFSFEKRERPEITKPKYVNMAKSGNDTSITIRWFRPSFYFEAAVAIVITLMLIPSFSDESFWVWDLSTLKEILLAFFGLAMLTGAYGFLYFYTLRGFLNITEIKMSYTHIQVLNRPFPPKNCVELARSDIAQIYCTRSLLNPNKDHIYTLVGVTRDGTHHVLSRSLVNKPTQILFVEQEIEKSLNIEDRSMLMGEFIGE